LSAPPQEKGKPASSANGDGSELSSRLFIFRDLYSDIVGSRGVRDFDKEKVKIMAREAEEAALRQIEREQVCCMLLPQSSYLRFVIQAESSKAKLSDFWLASLTPTATADKIKDVKFSPMYKAERPPHTPSLKDLIPVTFSSQVMVRPRLNYLPMNQPRFAPLIKRPYQTIFSYFVSSSLTLLSSTL
jgi:hypothetical protein